LHEINCFSRIDSVIIFSILTIECNAIAELYCRSWKKSQRCCQCTCNASHSYIVRYLLLRD